MYQGKPKLRKINHVNFNNPTLTSSGMKGVFYEPTSPQLVRDELKYNANFKDSLTRTIEEEEQKRRSGSSASKPYYEESMRNASPYGNYQPLKGRHREEVQSKVTEIPMNPYTNINYNGYQTIKSKQTHGFDIIKNF